MDTPDRSMLAGRPPPSLLLDTPTFMLINNMSPIAAMEAISSPYIARTSRPQAEPHSIHHSVRRTLFAAEAGIQDNATSLDSTTGAMPVVEGNNLTKPLSIGKDLCPTESEVECQIVDCKDSTASIVEESSEDSMKNKRLAENGAESSGCKRCKCKKSKCLKLYCECFAAGLHCLEPCSCQGCFNKPIHEEMIQFAQKRIEARNPLAFATKLIPDHQVSYLEGNDHVTPASARHRRGCNCRKSSCSKKYCECYQASVGCSISCRCEGCKNSFGRRDGIKEIEIKASSENTLAITQYNRPSIGMSIFSNAMAPQSQSTWLSTGGLPGFYAPLTFSKPKVVPPQPKSDNNFTSIFQVDDGIAAIPRLTGVYSTDVKRVSPSGREVHPSHNDSGLMPTDCASNINLIQTSVEARSELHLPNNNSNS